jgi:hypothetical protein
MHGISFDASLVMYINSTSIPPIMIMNRMYENQKLLYIVPLINPLNTKLNPICHLLALLEAHHILHVSGVRVKHTIVVCISSISPMAMGCFICVNINLVIVINSFVISGGILFFKMLVLGINEMVFAFPLKF